MEGPAQVKTGTNMCHSMSTESNKTGMAEVSKLVNDSERNHGPCCYKSLTNLNPDINAKIETISIDRAQLQLLNKDKIGFNKLVNNSVKEHDPPDLQISNSTFLL
jgi:hypothetical protein